MIKKSTGLIDATAANVIPINILTYSYITHLQ